MTKRIPLPGEFIICAACCQHPSECRCKAKEPWFVPPLVALFWIGYLAIMLAVGVGIVKEYKNIKPPAPPTPTTQNIPTIFLGTAGYAYRQAQNLCHAHHTLRAVEFDDTDAAMYAVCRDGHRYLVWVLKNAKPPVIPG